MRLCRGYNIKWYYSDSKNRYGFFKGLSPTVCVWVTKETVYIYCEGCHPKLLIILPFSNAMWPDNVSRDDAALLSAPWFSGGVITLSFASSELSAVSKLVGI